MPSTATFNQYDVLTTPEVYILKNQETPSKQEARPLPEHTNTMQAINLIMTGWKMLCNVPVGTVLEGAWDQVHKRDNEPYAYHLLLLFGTWEDAVKAMEYVYNWHKQRGLFVTLKTVVRNSDLARDGMR